jgi:hypothetical protein
MVMMYTKSKLLHILGALVAVAVLSAAEVNSEELTTGDRAAISDWFSQYAHVIDRRKFDTDFESLFAEGANIDYRASGGRKGTVPEIKVWLKGVFQFFGSSQHFISNLNFHNTTREGTILTAHVSAIFFNPMNLRYFPYEPFFTCGGWYHHEFVKTGKETWRSKQLTVEMAFNNVTPNLLGAFFLFCVLYFYCLGSRSSKREKVE